jgi:tetratricopeptide (TPR) repeat protein
MRKRISLATILAVAGGVWGGATLGPLFLSADEFKAVRECLDLMYYEQAVRLLGNILASDPEKRDMRYWMGYALMRIGRLDQSVIALKGEIEEHPGHGPARNLLDFVYYNLERDEDAELSAREAISCLGGDEAKVRAALKKQVAISTFAYNMVKKILTILTKT